MTETSNLEYVTHRGNSLHAARIGLLRSGARHYAFKITDQIASEIRAARGAGESGVSVAARFGISQGLVSTIYRKTGRFACKA